MWPSLMEPAVTPTSVAPPASGAPGVGTPGVAAAPGLAADTFERERWHAHLSLGSHDLIARPDLHDEVEAYVRGLAVEVPAEFAAEHVALYRLEHESWTGAWWRAMAWEHVRSWRLGA